MAKPSESHQKAGLTQMEGPRTTGRVVLGSLIASSLLLGCEPAVRKFIEIIDRESPIVQAIAATFERKVKSNVLDAALDLEHSTRVVFFGASDLTSSQACLVSAAAAAALFTQDSMSSLSLSKTVDTLSASLLLAQMVLDGLKASAPLEDAAIHGGEIVVDGHRTFMIRKAVSHGSSSPLTHALEIVLESPDISRIRLEALFEAGGGVHAVYSTKKSPDESLFIQAGGKFRDDRLEWTSLKYRVKQGGLVIEEHYGSPHGSSPALFITGALLSGSGVTVDEFLNRAQAGAAESAAGILHEIFLTQYDAGILEHALNWEGSARVEFVRAKPLNAAEKELMSLVVLTGLLARDVDDRIPLGKTKEISIFLALAAKSLFEHTAALPSENISIDRARLFLDGRSDLEFVHAKAVKEAGTSNVRIKFRLQPHGNLTLHVNVPASGSSEAEFHWENPDRDRSVRMKSSAEGSQSGLVISRFMSTINNRPDLSSKEDIMIVPGITVHDLIRNHLVAGSLVTVEDIKGLLEEEKIFSASVQEARGDFAAVLSNLNLGRVKAQYNADGTVIFTYKPGTVEFTVSGMVKGSEIQIPETSLQEAVFVGETFGKCVVRNVNLSGNCTILDENRVSCNLILRGDIENNTPAYCFVPKVNAETELEVVFTVN